MQILWYGGTLGLHPTGRVLNALAVPSALSLKTPPVDCVPHTSPASEIANDSTTTPLEIAISVCNRSAAETEHDDLTAKHTDKAMPDVQSLLMECRDVSSTLAIEERQAA